MKRVMKSLICIIICASIMAGIPSIGAFAKDAKTEKEIAKVEKALADDVKIKSGKYTYYIDSSAPAKKLLIREDENGNKKQINKNIEQFFVEGKYVIYRTTKSPSLFRMKTDGTCKERLDTYVRNVYMVKDGYVYYNRFSNLFRIKVNGTERKRLVRSNYSAQFAIVGDRVYYVVQKLIDDKSGTDYSYVRSMKLDGSDVRKEIKKRDGWGEIMTIGDRVIVEYPPLKGEKSMSWYVLSEDGKWTKNPVSNIARVCKSRCESAEDEKVYFLISAETDGDDEESDKLYKELGIERENAVYSMDLTGKLEKVIDLDKAGVKLTYEYDSIEEAGDYFIILTGYDQSMAGLYVVSKAGKKLCTVDLEPLGEEGTVKYKIVKDVLYVRLNPIGTAKYAYYNLAK